MDKQREITEVLQAMADANGGKITAEQVVTTAKDPESPLHDQFEWDDKKAAYKHRLDTGRQLIRSVRIEVTKNMTVIHAPAYVRDPDLDAKEQGYVDVRTLRSDEESRRHILIAEFKRVNSVFERAADIAVYFNMEDKLENMQRTIKIMVAELGESPRA